MKKRILSIVLTLALCLSLLPTAVLAAEGTAVTSITVKTKSGEESSDITLPGTGEEIAQLQLHAYDQSGQSLDNSSVSWSLKTDNGRNFTGEGVFVNDQGVVTVNYHASVGTVYVQASVTTESGEVVSDNFSITIKKVRAVKEIVFYKTSVETGNEVKFNADTINIVDDTFSKAVYCAVVNDQYGDTLSLAEVTWSEPEKTPAENAFNYTSDDGILTVSPAEGSTAQNGTAVFTATCGNASAQLTLRFLKRDDQTVSVVDQDGNAVKDALNLIYGDTGKSITARSAEITNPSVTYTVKDEEGKTEANILTINNDGGITVVGIGEVTVIVSVAGNDNYVPVTREITVTVGPKDLSAGSASGITVDPIPDRRYDGTFLRPKIVIKDNGKELTEGTDYTIQQQTGGLNDDGEYVVTVNIQGIGNYKNWIYPQFKVLPATLTLTGLNAADRTYDGTTDIKLSSGTLQGVHGVDNVSFTASGTVENGNVGTDKAVEVTVTLSGAHKYFYTVEAVTDLTADILPAELRVTGLTAANRDYNGTNIVNITDATLEGIVGTDDVSVNTTDLTGSLSGADAGDYTEVVTLSRPLTLTGEAAGNYTLTQPTNPVTTNVTISPATITVTADNKSAIVGTAQPELTYTVTGLQGTDQLTKAPSLSCTPDMNIAGEYTITISGAEQSSGNYTISHFNGKLTVSNKTTPTLTLTPSKTSLSGGGSVTLTVGSLPTGGSVTVTCDNTTYNPTGSGTAWSVTLPNTTATYVFTASFAGDDAHNSATATCTVNVTYKSSGGGGVGGYTPPSTPATESVTVPISGDEETIHVGASVSGDKATVDEVDLSHLDTVIGDHVEDIGTVTIDFSNLDSSKPITTVEIPSDVVKQIAEAVNNPANDAQSLEVILSDGTSIEFDAVALGEKAAQADGLDITISIEHHDDAELTQAQKNAVGDRPAFDINVTSGGKHISDMGGKITVHAPYKLKASEKVRGIVVWYVDDAGNRERCETSYDPIKQRVNWKTDHLSLYMIDYCPSAVFTDLDIGAWYHEATDYVIENGMMAGYGETFGPNDSITRGQIVTILHRLEGAPVVNYLMTYEDVAQEKYYAEAIRWATSEGIVAGYGNGKFGPDDPITRQQLATILWRYSQHKGYNVSVGENTNILSYEDAFDISEYAIPAIQWACGAGVMGGYGNGYLGPNDGATRVQAAQMLKNFMVKAAK